MALAPPQGGALSSSYMSYLVVFFIPIVLAAHWGGVGANLFANDPGSRAACFVSDSNPKVFKQLNEIAAQHPDGRVRLLVGVEPHCHDRVFAQLRSSGRVEVSSLGDGYNLLIVAKVKEAAGLLDDCCVQSVYVDRLVGN